MLSFEYLNTEHKKAFQDLRGGMAEENRFDKKYLSVCFLIAGNIQLRNKMNPYFDRVTGNLHSDLMFEEQDFTSDIRVLARLALNLFTDSVQVSPLELVESLDEEAFKLSLNAVLIRRHGIPKSYPKYSE